MEEKTLQKAISSFNTLVLIKLKGNGDVYQTPFEYLSGKFSLFGLRKFQNFQEVLRCIYRSAPICEGVGYYEYLNQIRESIYFCQREGRRASFLLPLRKGGRTGETKYFFLTLNKRGSSLYAAFLYYDVEVGLVDIDDFSSGTFKDRLTGLFNYRTMVSHIGDNKRKGYLCLFDLDGFKKINDVYGHETGDEVLKSIADYLIGIATMNEVFYRRSGDEFAILIFEKGIKYAFNLINKVEAYIESIPGKLGKDFVVSASFGILELVVPKEGEPVFDYLTQSKLIDLAMYQAKTSKKRYHYITHDDAINIVEKGDLDKRVDAFAKSLRR